MPQYNQFIHRSCTFVERCIVIKIKFFFFEIIYLEVRSSTSQKTDTTTLIADTETTSVHYFKYCLTSGIWSVWNFHTWIQIAAKIIPSVLVGAVQTICDICIRMRLRSTVDKCGTYQERSFTLPHLALKSGKHVHFKCP